MNRGPLPGSGGWSVAVEDLVLFLFHALVVPSGLTTRVQPQRWMTIWWWNGHSSTQSLTEVVPPWALCFVWWTWQAPAGWVQPPAHWQCRSRSSTALRIPAGIDSAYPMSSGRLGPPRRTPSCRRRRNEASPPGPDSRSTALPMTACSTAAHARWCRERRVRAVAALAELVELDAEPTRSSRASMLMSPVTMGAMAASQAMAAAASPSSQAPSFAPVSDAAARRAAQAARVRAVHSSCRAELPGSRSRSARVMWTQALTGCPARSGSRFGRGQPAHRLGERVVIPLALGSVVVFPGRGG